MSTYYEKNREKILAQQRRYRTENAEMIHAYDRARGQRFRSGLYKDYDRARKILAYGVDAGTYSAMLSEQHGVCVICSKVNKNGRRLGIDHDHVSGRVRGLLCGKCNMAIGLLGDDAGVVTRALEYLKKNSTQLSPINDGGNSNG